MGVESLLVFIIIGAIAGWLAGLIVSGFGFGLIGNIIVGIVINLILIYAVLKSSQWLEDRMGPGGLAVLRKIFGIILLAIAIKLFKTNLIPGF